MQPSVIGRASLPTRFEAWNRRWGAPYGRPLPRVLRRLPASSRRRTRKAGPFALQANNSTRAFEYPWAYHAVPLGPGHTVVDLGGGLAGFQFTLSAAGATVRNVDPFVDFGTAGHYAGIEPTREVERLNAAFGTHVSVTRASLDEAGLQAGSVDTVYCISTIEHLPDDELDRAIGAAAEVLKAGGHLVLTVDLFLDLEPFTSRRTNRWGRNLDVRALVARSGLELVQGRPEELHGFDEFDPDSIQSNLSELMVGTYPGLAQALTLRKP